MKSKINVMLVEDHLEYRETLEYVLSKEKDIELVSQYGNAEMALRSLKDCALDKQPHIILLDLKLPGMSGMEAMPWFTKYSPKAKIIILSQSNQHDDVLSAVKYGAAGYLLKSCTMDEIKQGIRIVHEGGATLEPSLARFILKTLQPQIPESANEPILSKREVEVLTLIGTGLPHKQIGSELNISIYTVTDHLRHIYEKLGVANGPQAISKAYESGILPTKKE